jgi:hypothetical protein
MSKNSPKQTVEQMQAWRQWILGSSKKSTPQKPKYRKNRKNKKYNNA